MVPYQGMCRGRVVHCPIEEGAYGMDGREGVGGRGGGLQQYIH